jgi:AmiR/NasT family two-component response regulator
MTPRSLRIAVADDEPDTREFFERYLPRLGHQVVASAEDGRRLVELCRTAKPDMIVTDIRMPGMTGLEAVGELFREQTVPVIVVTAHADAEWVEQAQAVGVSGYLLKPITEKELAPAIAVAWRQFEQFQALRKEAADLRQALEERKLVERAKGAVMRRVGIGEADAFRRMRKFASDRNLKLAEVARHVLAAEEVFRELDGGER